MSSEKDSTAQSAGSAGLAIIEKASEVRWTLQLAQVVLFADVALLWKTGHGILEWSTTSEQLMSSSGLLMAALLGFGVMASIILPGLGELIRVITGQIGILIPFPQWLQTGGDYTRHVGTVRPKELLDLALKENSSFLLDLYTQHKEQQEENRAAQYRAGSLIFGVLVVACADFTVARSWAGMSLIGAVHSGLGEYGGIALAGAALLAFLALKWAWFSDWDSGWIYYPPLYEAIEKKRRERLGTEWCCPPPMHHQESNGNLTGPIGRPD